MINQLVAYLRAQFPAYNFVLFYDPKDKQDTIAVRLTGGSVEGYPMERVDATFQVIVKSQDRQLALGRILDIYSYLKENFDFDLPAVPALSLPAVNVAKLSANQYPGEVSIDGSGVYNYVCNFTCVFSDKTP
jgi:hypothetical protein